MAASNTSTLNQKGSTMPTNRDLFKMVSLVGGRRQLHFGEQYTPLTPSLPKAQVYAGTENFSKDTERIDHDQIDRYQKQNQEMASVLAALASTVQSLIKEIKTLKIPPVEVTVRERIDPIKVEIPTVKIEQEPIKVEVELKQPEKSAKRKGTIRHADGTTSTVEVS